MTDAQKVEKLAERLDEAANERAREEGGYPDIVRVVAGWLVIAGSSEEGEPFLDCYSPANAADWYDRARALRRRYEWIDAIWQSAPEPNP